MHLMPYTRTHMQSRPEQRLREDEEARRLAAELEQKRLRLLAQHLSDPALDRQRASALQAAAALATRRRAAGARRAEEREWARYVACPHLPDPRAAAAMNDHLRELEAAGRPGTVVEALQAIEVRARVRVVGEQCHYLFHFTCLLNSVP
jgi:hypothetical protein